MQRTAVSSEHVRQEHILETVNAALDGRHFAFDPVMQDRVDGDVSLLECTLLVFNLRSAAAIRVRVFLQPDLRPAFSGYQLLHLSSAIGEREQYLMLLEVVHEANGLTTKTA